MDIERGRSLSTHLPEEVQAADKVRYFDRIRYDLAEVVKSAGEAILSWKGNIYDTGESHGQDESSLDEEARDIVNKLLDKTFPHIEGVRRFELRPINVVRLESDETTKKLFFIIDEIDGTTNTKRELSMREYLDGLAPRGGVCIAISESESLGDIQVGAVYAMDRRVTYTGSHIGGGQFFSYQEEEKIMEDTHRKMRGDDKERIMCIGYSNRNRLHKGLLEYALFAQAELVTYGDGVRSSSMDIINIFRNAYDAYVDVRAAWPQFTELLVKDSKGNQIMKENAMLRAYDICAVLPFALGLGFYVTDVWGKDLKDYDLNSAIPLVIARNQNLRDKILETIEPLVDPDNQELITKAVLLDIGLIKKLRKQKETRKSI